MHRKSCQLQAKLLIMKEKTQMKRILGFLLLVLSIITLEAQTDTCNIINGVLSTYPVFPNQNAGVTIYFDATKGNAALKDYSGDIYAHTGVITDKSPNDDYWLYVVSSWGENLPKTKFTRISDNLYKLEIPNIRDYYGVPSDEKILDIVMVIRSGDKVNGDYIVARNEDGSDFRIKLYDSVLNVKIVSPSQNKIFAAGDTVKICAFSLMADSMRINLNDSLVASSTADSLNYQYIIPEKVSGLFKAVAIAYQNTDSIADTVNFTVLPPEDTLPLPAGVHNGVNIIDGHTVTFVLEDPPAKKKFALLIGDFNNWTPAPQYLMHRTPDGKHFWLTVSGLEPDIEYGYQFLIDGKLRLADPYAHKILDPWNDKYIPSQIYPNPKPYPAGKTYGIVSVFKTNPPIYQWQDTNFVAPDYKKLVVYELLIRDFVKSHWIVDVEKKLDYLQQLGINAIELMPFNEFEGNISWGYNPDFYFAVDKYYGTAEQFKHFIDEAHKRGIAVIMDIVFNHAFYLCPLVQMYWDSQNNRPSDDNPWFNPTPRHPFSPGYDFNHDSPYTKEFVKDALKYWLTEFKIDGFRFDLSKGFTQRYSNDVASWSAYDQDRINILTGYANFIKSINPKAYVILEHFAEDKEEQELAKNGMLLWNNSTYAFQQAIMGWLNGSDFSRIFYQQHGFSQPRALSYMESHDEERLIYKAITWGNSYGDYDVKDIKTAINREKMMAGLFFSAPGPKMVWQFGELGYGYSINTCEDGTIDESCRTSPKPIRWDYYYDPTRKSLYDYYSKLIHWKTHDNIFDSASYYYQLGGAVKQVKITSSNKNAFIFGNFSVSSITYNLAFPHAGYWFDWTTDSTYFITEPSKVFQLEPGEYHFFTDYYIDQRPDSLKAQQGSAKVFPNPATRYILVDNPDMQEISLFDITGNKIRTIIPESSPQLIYLDDLKPGLYFIKINTTQGIITKKFIKE